MLIRFVFPQMIKNIGCTQRDVRFDLFVARREELQFARRGLLLREAPAQGDEERYERLEGLSRENVLSVLCKSGPGFSPARSPSIEGEGTISDKKARMLY